MLLVGIETDMLVVEVDRTAVPRLSVPEEDLKDPVIVVYTDPFRFKLTGCETSGTFPFVAPRSGAGTNVYDEPRAEGGPSTYGPRWFDLPFSSSEANPPIPNRAGCPRLILVRDFVSAVSSRPLKASRSFRPSASTDAISSFSSAADLGESSSSSSSCVRLGRVGCGGRGTEGEEIELDDWKRRWKDEGGLAERVVARDEIDEA